jgi:hypothetical protein
MGPVLTAADLATFDRDGIVKVEGVFGEDTATRMRDVLWHELHRRYEIERDDPSTWYRHAPTGLKSTKKSRVFTPMLGPRLTEALDQLFGPEQWVTPKHLGQVLVTMPNAEAWRVPRALWHADFQYTYPPDELMIVKCWALFDDVAPGGGGTPQLAGSHRLTARYIDGRTGNELEYKRVRDGLLRSHPWLKALATGRDGDDAQFMAADADVDGLPARVVELTGRTGDVFVTHPWTMHSIAVNATHRPRLMRSFAIQRRTPEDASLDRE